MPRLLDDDLILGLDRGKRPQGQGEADETRQENSYGEGRILQWDRAAILPNPPARQTAHEGVVEVLGEKYEAQRQVGAKEHHEGRYNPELHLPASMRAGINPDRTEKSVDPGPLQRGRRQCTIGLTRKD